MRETLAKIVIPNPPKGDLIESMADDRYVVSCVFVFYERIHLMQNILHCLNSQSLDKHKMEVILVEDKGGSRQGKNLISLFPDLHVSHFAPEHQWGHMGYMRNVGLSKASGTYVLFLDDDTVILDPHFLLNLIGRFETNDDLQAVIPFGSASYAIIQGKYDYHDPYFFTNRCMAYRRSCLVSMKGFDSGFIGQEDVEFAVRFLAKGHKSCKAEDLHYYHPPMVYHDAGKGMAVGASFARSKYSFFAKLLLGINGMRWLPLGLIPRKDFRNKATCSGYNSKSF